MISILITHFNRFESLLICLHSFKSLSLRNVEFVVSDDGSEPSVQNKLKNNKVDTLILNDINTGLSSNLNRGIRACKGSYILYCQEDYIPKAELSFYILQAINIIKSGKADMCRLKANYNFPHLIPLNSDYNLIPKFSWKNFYYNTFQYSDNPFITRSDFFNDYGFFLDNVSGPYGENEYAIRIMKSRAKIAICNVYQFKENQESESVIMGKVTAKSKTFSQENKIASLSESITIAL